MGRTVFQVLEGISLKLSAAIWLLVPFGQGWSFIPNLSSCLYICIDLNYLYISTHELDLEETYNYNIVDPFMF